MRITEIDLWHVSIPTPEPFYPSWIPGFPQTDNRFTLLRIGTAAGLQGWSAGSALSREREGIGNLLGPYLLGERADDIPSIRQRLREMSYLGLRIGWVEAACWDIMGKAVGQPVYRLLGGDLGTVKLYASTGEVKSGKERTKEVEARLAEGFEAVKLRVHEMSLEADVAQIREVRKNLGDRPILGVDANQGWRVAVVADAPLWDFPRALEFCKAAEDFGYSWVEEPLAMDDYDGLARLRAETKIDIAGGELVSDGLPAFKVMLNARCLDKYQPDATFVGGIAATWEIIQLVKAAGAKYTPHSWSNGIGFAINLQLHAASPWRDETYFEYPYNPPSWVPSVRDGLLTHPFLHDKGQLQLPSQPGLGFDIDPKALKKYGDHFFRATKLRVAVKTAWDKGLRNSLEANSVRQRRLRERHKELDRLFQQQGLTAAQLATRSL